jgi:hypothetical protein
MKRGYAGVVVATGVALSLGACKPVEDWLARQVASVMDRKIDEVRDRLAGLDKTNARLEERIQKLATEVDVNEKWNAAWREMYKEESASLSSDCQKYGVARTNLGPVIITCDSVDSYLDGFKIRLLASVLVPIEVSGLSLTVSWSEPDEKYREKGKGPWRQKEVESLVSFYPGRYSAIEVPLTPASAAGIKSLTISVKANRVSIAKPSQPERKN